MMALEFVVVVEQQRQRFVDFDRREISRLRIATGIGRLELHPFW